MIHPCIIISDNHIVLHVPLISTVRRLSKSVCNLLFQARFVSHFQGFVLAYWLNCHSTCTSFISRSLSMGPHWFRAKTCPTLSRMGMFGWCLVNTWCLAMDLNTSWLSRHLNWALDWGRLSLKYCRLLTGLSRSPCYTPLSLLTQTTNTSSIHSRGDEFQHLSDNVYMVISYTDNSNILLI